MHQVFQDAHLYKAVIHAIVPLPIITIIITVVILLSLGQVGLIIRRK